MLVDRGVTEFDFIISHLPERIEHLLGDGARWGSQFRFHLARDASRPYGMLRTLSGADTDDANGADGPILLAHADRLPQLPESMNPPAGQDEAAYCVRDTAASSEKYEWT